jgi:hypothetical protein
MSRWGSTPEVAVQFDCGSSRYNKAPSFHEVKFQRYQFMKENNSSQLTTRIAFFTAPFLKYILTKFNNKILCCMLSVSERFFIASVQHRYKSIFYISKQRNHLS